LASSNETSGSAATLAVIAELTFEAALGRLEQIVRDLEGGDASLSESMHLFEQGVALARRCSDLLSVAERKIDLLVEEADGTYSLRPLDGINAADDPTREQA
jgi:exodeoxyribonuclease VII small subunit